MTVRRSARLPWGARRGGLAWGLCLAMGMAFALMACANFDPMKREQSFQDSHKRFTQYLRWGKIAHASRYVHPELRGEFMNLAPELTEMYFTDYEVLSTEVADDLESAVVDVRISGYRASWPIERSHVLKEEWRREGPDWMVRLDMESLRKAIAPEAP